MFSIIAYASRAFAAYYAIQCGMAALHLVLVQRDPRGLIKTAFFVLLSIAMIVIAIFGISAESAGSA